MLNLIALVSYLLLLVGSLLVIDVVDEKINKQLREQTFRQNVVVGWFEDHIVD